MIQEAKKHIFEILKTIPKNALVLDVGGASDPFKEVTGIIDFVPFDTINTKQAKGCGKIQYSENTYISHDICPRNPWSLKEKGFDFSVYSPAFEEVSDPLWVRSEIIMISKAGYVEVSPRLYETTFNLEIKF